MQSIDPNAAHEGEILAADEAAASAEEADAWAAFSARMEAFGRQMAMHDAATEADAAAIEQEAEAMASEIEQQFAEGGALHAAIMRQTQAATALAMVEACAAQASRSDMGTATCDGSDPAAAGTEAAIEANVMRSVAHALNAARATIAANTQLSAEERAEVLAELDAEIAELHAGH